MHKLFIDHCVKSSKVLPQVIFMIQNCCLVASPLFFKQMEESLWFCYCSFGLLWHDLSREKLLKLRSFQVSSQKLPMKSFASALYEIRFQCYLRNSFHLGLRINLDHLKSLNFLKQKG